MDWNGIADAALGFGADLLTGRAGPLGYIGAVAGVVATQLPSSERAALSGLVRGLPGVAIDSWDAFAQEWKAARADDTLSVSEIKALKAGLLTLISKSLDSVIDLVFVVLPFWFSITKAIKGRGDGAR